MRTGGKLTPTELSSLLIPRFLAKEPCITARSIRKEYKVPPWTASQAVRISRTILREEHGVCLPIAHRDDYALMITENPVDAFRGELPQVRNYQTLGEHLAERMTWTMTQLEKDSPLLSKTIMASVDAQMHSLNAVLETVEAYMVERVGPRKDGAA